MIQSSFTDGVSMNIYVLHQNSTFWKKQREIVGKVAFLAWMFSHYRCESETGWSFELSSIIPQTEAEEVIGLLSLVVLCIFNPSDKSMQSRRTQLSPFSCSKCWRKSVRKQNKGLLVKPFWIPLQFDPSSVLPPSGRPKSFCMWGVYRKEAFKGDS